MEEYKCCVIGTAAAGKSCLIQTFKTGEFPTEYIPTAMESVSATLEDGAVKMDIHDIAGEEVYDRLRLPIYPGTHVFIICFDIGSSHTLDDVATKWKPELDENMPGTPYILVGLKADCAGREFAIGPGDGEKMAKQIGAAGYLTCSAKEKQGLTEVFQLALSKARSAKTSDGAKKKSGGGCVVQ